MHLALVAVEHLARERGIDPGEERIQIIANEISPLADVAAKARANGNGKSNGHGQPVHLYVRESEVSSEELVELRDTLLRYPGSCAVFLHLLISGSDETIIELPEQVRVAFTSELQSAIGQKFGPRIAFHALES